MYKLRQMVPDDGRFGISSSRVASNKQQQQKAEEEEVVATSAAAVSSLVSHELTPDDRSVPSAIVKVDTGDVPRLLHEMLGDDDFDRQQRVMILTSDTGRGHFAAAEVGWPTCVR